MRSSGPGGLRRRITTTAALAMAAGLALAGVLTFEIVLANERAALDRALVRQRDHLSSELGAGLAGTGDPSAETLRSAVERFLDEDVVSEDFITVVRLDEDRFVGGSTDEDLVQYVRGGGLDGVPTGILGTIHTGEGDMRALGASLRVNGDSAGRVMIAGPLAPARLEAAAAAQRLALAAAASLVVGTALVWWALGKVLRPLEQLTAAARGAELVDLGARVDVDSHDDEVAELAGEFNAMLDRLEQATAARERLLATISHELRTPLAVAQGHLELAARPTAGEDETARAVGVAREELARVNRLVSDLLALGRSGQAGFLQRRDIASSELAREVELRIDGLGLDTVTVAPGDGTLLHLDADRLLQAILNCVVNSIEHNPTGTTADVTWEVLEPSAAGRELVVRVADDGLGLPADLVDRAFEPFVMGRSDRDPLRSSGLGLAVVAAVATAHGGDASIESTRSGTTVELRIPCGRPTDRR